MSGASPFEATAREVGVPGGSGMRVGSMAGACKDHAKAAGVIRVANARRAYEAKLIMTKMLRLVRLAGWSPIAGLP